MRMVFSMLAVSVWVVHLGWTLLLASGVVVVLVKPSYAPIHLVVVSGTLLLNLALRDCPLTITERLFRRAAGWDAERRSFTQRLLAGVGWRMTNRGTNRFLLLTKIGSYAVTVTVMAL